MQTLPDATLRLGIIRNRIRIRIRIMIRIRIRIRIRMHETIQGSLVYKKVPGLSAKSSTLLTFLPAPD